MINGEVRVVDSVANAFAEVVAEQFAHRTSSRFTIALSGGSTAEPCHLALVDHDIDWSVVDIFWSDERCVDLDNPKSNAGNAIRNVFHKFSDATLHPMRCEDGPDAYEFDLRTHFPLNVVQLGIGTDGHTASLFPGSSALEIVDRFVVNNLDPSGTNPLPRMTFTFSGIEAAECVIVTVSGEEKAAIMNQIISSNELPAAHITGKNVIWLLDPAAAARMLDES